MTRCRPGAVIHIVPRLAGPNLAVFQAVLGAALLLLFGGTRLGAAAVSGMYMTGASMVLAVWRRCWHQNLKCPEMRQTDNGRQNTYFRR